MTQPPPYGVPPQQGYPQQGYPQQPPAGYAPQQPGYPPQQPAGFLPPPPPSTKRTIGFWMGLLTAVVLVLFVVVVWLITGS